MSDKTREEQKRLPKSAWKPGQSGNPRGCPTGSRHKATLAIQALLDGEGEALTRKAVEMALAGDITALRLCLERLCPPRKDAPITLAALPKIEGAADVPQAVGAILDAVTQGELTPGEGQALAGLVDGYRKALETTELERRISALEGKKDNGNKS